MNYLYRAILRSTGCELRTLAYILCMDRRYKFDVA